MNDLRNDLEKIYKPSTTRTYIANISFISKKLGHNVVPSGDTSEWISIQKLKSVIKDTKPTTQRNYISAIIALMKSRNESHTELYTQLSQWRDRLNATYEERINSGEKTENEKSNWSTVEELGHSYLTYIVPILDRIKLRSPKTTNRYNPNSFMPSELKIFRDAVILAFYFYPFVNLKEGTFGIMRNDIATIIYNGSAGRSKKSTKVPVNKNNYFTPRMGTTPARIYLRDHKTDRVKGDEIINLPSELGDILSNYAIFIGAKHGDQLFPRTTKHDITLILQRFTQKYLHKKIGTQMLRKIYITSRYGDETEERKEVADSMGHSLEMQQSVYTKTNRNPKSKKEK